MLLWDPVRGLVLQRSLLWLEWSHLLLLVLADCILASPHIFCELQLRLSLRIDLAAHTFTAKGQTQCSTAHVCMRRFRPALRCCQCNRRLRNCSVGEKVFHNTLYTWRYRAEDVQAPSQPVVDCYELLSKIMQLQVTKECRQHTHRYYGMSYSQRRKQVDVSVELATMGIYLAQDAHCFPSLVIHLKHSSRAAPLHHCHIRRPYSTEPAAHRPQHRMYSNKSGLLQISARWTGEQTSESLSQSICMTTSID
jgi:hypothetical protein